MLRWESPSDILREIDDALAFREQHMAAPRLVRDWFTGAQYRHGRGKDLCESVVHAYTAMLLPRVAHDNPRVRVTSALPRIQAEAVTKIEGALNRWSQLTRFRGTIERLAMDYIMGWAVALVTNEPVKSGRYWDADGPYLPRVYRINPEHFILDPLAGHFEESRWAGHQWFIDKQDLIRKAETEPYWDLKAVEALATTTDREEMDERQVPDRRQVAIYEIWVPELHQQEGEEWDRAMDDARVNGTVFTVGRYQSSAGANASEFIRAPRPYYGPRQGPYTLFGAYAVPGDPYPLSPIVAVMRQAEAANVAAESQERAAREYRRLAVSRDSQKIQDVLRDPSVQVVPGEPQTVGQIEVGGQTPQHQAAAAMTLDRFDRAIGMSDALRGNITGDGTATEAAIAQGAANARIAHVTRNFVDSVESVETKVAWYMWHDGRITLNVPELARSAKMDGLFTGGVMAGSFEDLDIRVDAYSMERTTEALSQKRAQEAVQMAIGVAQAQAAMPWIRGDLMMGVLADANNMPQMRDFLDRSRLPQGVPNARV
jgi:hypothetical protein